MTFTSQTGDWETLAGYLQETWALPEEVALRVAGRVMQYGKSVFDRSEDSQFQLGHLLYAFPTEGCVPRFFADKNPKLDKVRRLYSYLGLVFVQ